MDAQWRRRVKVVEFFYAAMAGGLKGQEAETAAFEDYDFDAEMAKVVAEFAKNGERYVASLTGLLRSEWRWDRVALMDRAILLQAVCEHAALSTPPPVLLDQAATTARHYCEEDSHKFVNGILSAYFKAQAPALV